MFEQVIITSFILSVRFDKFIMLAPTNKYSKGTKKEKNSRKKVKKNEVALDI